MANVLANMPFMAVRHGIDMRPRFSSKSMSASAKAGSRIYQPVP
jgi:hypothetical protein